MSWHDKKCVCVLGQNDEAVVFGDAAVRPEFQAGLYAKQQNFYSSCLGDDLGSLGNFPVWIFGHYGKYRLHPVAADTEYEGGADEENFRE